MTSVSRCLRERSSALRAYSGLPLTGPRSPSSLTSDANLVARVNSSRRPLRVLALSCSPRIIDQPIYPLHTGAVRLLPILVVFPRLWGEHQPQSRSSSRTCASPRSTASTASSNRRAFAGELKRWAVSCQAENSSAAIRTALPCFEVISTGARSLFTCSINGNRLLRASLAVIAISSPFVWYLISYHCPLRMGIIRRRAAAGQGLRALPSRSHQAALRHPGASP